MGKSILFFLLWGFMGIHGAKAQNTLLNQNIDSNNKICIGAYYFGGWQSLNNNIHLTSLLKTNFQNREPKWGWVTGTQQIMNKQIVAASDAGISFFSFCWYDRGNKTVKQANPDLYYFNHSPEKNKLKFCLMVANHKGSEIGPNEWQVVTSKWLRQFQFSNYLKVDGKPLIIFFTVGALVKKFGSPAKVARAMKEFQEKSKSKGFAGVELAACIGPGVKQIERAKACGFQIFTGYNYHTAGLRNAHQKQKLPIDSMQAAEKRIWNAFAKNTSEKYMPVVTLNWDPRPWATKKNKYNTKPCFVGYSPNSVYKSVAQAINWVKQNPKITTSPKIILLYAWNEYGEGGYLTPTKNGVNFLNGLKRAIDESKSKN